MRLLKMDGEDNAPISSESQNQEVVLVKTPRTPKTPRKLIVNVDKDIPELQKHDAASKNVIEAETAKAPMETEPSQETNDAQDDSSEPEIKKRKKGRPSLSERIKDVPVKQRSSSRSTKGKHSKGHTIANDAPPSSPVNVTVRKPQMIRPIVDIFGFTSSTREVSAKENSSAPKPNETPATNVAASTLKKPATLTPGTARKRVGGEGRIASLQRILLELPNLCDPNVFSDVLMKTYGSRLEASKVFECLPSSDLKEAVVKKFTASELMASVQESDLKEAIVKRFTPSELMALVQESDRAGGKFLAMASAEAILQEIQSRQELRSSGKLLNALLQNVGDKLSSESKKALNNENVIDTVFDFASVDTVVKKVKARPDLKSSEKLINILLPNLPEKLSNETKKNVVKVLNEKFNTGELVDISHAAIKMSIDKNHKQ